MSTIKRYITGFVLILLLPWMLYLLIRENKVKSICVAVAIIALSVCAFIPEKELPITDLSAAFNTGIIRHTTNYIVIHHTAGNADGSINDVVRIHYGEHKWSTIGYHYYISKDGKVYRLKSDDEVAPHTLGHNDDAVGIVCAGDFNLSVMPKEQYNALVRLTKVMMTKDNLSTSRIKRLCDLNTTECPGSKFDFEAFIDDVE